MTIFFIWSYVIHYIELNSVGLCPDPSKDTSAKVIGDGFYNGKEVEFQCPENEVLIPGKSSKLTCERGSWNGTIPSCKGTKVSICI